MIEIAAVAIHRLGHLDAMGARNLPVVGAMARGDMDEARALLGRDEAARQKRHGKVIAAAGQRMMADNAGQTVARARPEDAGCRDAGSIGDGPEQLLGQDQLGAGRDLASLRHRIDLEQDVVDRLAIGDGAVARDGPGRRRPDHRRGSAEDRIHRGPHGEGDIDRVRDMVVILDLRLGERGLLHHRPEHRLGAAEEPAVHQELADLAQDLRLGGEGHGGIGVGPIALDPQAAELLALDPDPMAGEVAAFLAELDDGHGILVLALLAILLLDLPFDGQAVAVPARHVMRVLAQHLLRAVDDVLQDLVEGVADMDRAIGIGRSVMEHEFRPALGSGAQLGVEPHFRPARQDLRLALGQIGAHREIGARQEDRCLVIRWLGVRRHRLAVTSVAA